MNTVTYTGGIDLPKSLPDLKAGDIVIYTDGLGITQTCLYWASGTNGYLKYNLINLSGVHVYIYPTMADLKRALLSNKTVKIYRDNIINVDLGRSVT